MNLGYIYTFEGGLINLTEIQHFELMLFFCHNHLFNKIKFVPGFLMDTLSTCDYFENAEHSFPIEVSVCNLRVNLDLVSIKIPNSTILCFLLSPYTLMTLLPSYLGKNIGIGCAD